MSARLVLGSANVLHVHAEPLRAEAERSLPGGTSEAALVVGLHLRERIHQVALADRAQDAGHHDVGRRKVVACDPLAIRQATLDVAEIQTIRVQVFGDTGVVLGYITLQGRAGKTRYDGDYSFLDVYAKRDGRWRAVLSSGDRASQMLA